MNLTALQIAFAISLTILTTATVATLVLLRRSPGNETLKKVKIIVRSWWVMIGILLLGLALGRYGLAALFFGISAFALLEYMKVSRLSYLKKALVPILLIALTAQYVTLLTRSDRLFYALVPLMAIWVLPTVIVATSSVKNIAEVFGTTFGLLLVGYYLSYIPAIPFLLPGPREDMNEATIAIVTLVLLTEGNDVFQFLSGKLFGRRKILPLISPNKTEAGFIGGIVMTSLVSVVITRPLLGLELSQAALLGASISFAGILGDLFFSALKRYFGIKDFSDLIPGHGGILDRVDSLVLAAPIFFHLMYAFKEGLL